VAILIDPGSAWMIWAGTLGAGFFIGPLFPSAFTLAENRMTMTGRITGWFLVGAGAGGMFFPWFIGQWFESVGPWVMMAIILAAVVATFGAVALFSVWSKEPALEELA